MATFNTTTTPTMVPSIEAGTLYVIKNHGINQVHLHEASSAPSVTLDAYIINGRLDNGVIDGASIKLESGDNLYAWTDRGESLLYYDEAPS